MHVARGAGELGRVRYGASFAVAVLMTAAAGPDVRRAALFSSLGAILTRP